MACCVSFIKYLMFLFNILFWLAGGAILGVGIYVSVDSTVQNIVSVAGVQITFAAAIALIVFGSIMFIVGFCGCCGAIKENQCLLGTYFVLVLLIFIAQLGIGIWAFTSRTTIENEIRKGLNNSVPINTTNEQYVTSVKDLQKFFKCCGLVNGCEDWPSGSTEGCSCSGTSDTCVAPSGSCTNTDPSGGNIYKEDCLDATLNFIDDNIIIIAGIALGIGLFEIFGMAFAMIMCTNARAAKGYETY
ncbi:unnamed protein product [Clavelina lepadiformis]|uniref:Tetraspanin n=1 Tax=Clavelina lepadiformis TaxID=159417 RepID=A0ABP0FF18_CLALP